VGKPNERERDYYSASGKYISATITHFQPREKPLTTQKLSPKICLDFCAKSVQLYGFAQKLHLEKCAKQVCCTDFLYDRPPSKKLRKTASKMCQSCLDFCAQVFVVRTVRIRTVRPPTTKNQQHSKQKFLLGICAQALLGNVPSCCPLSSLKLTQKSLSISSLNVSCTLPNAFFYKSENDIFPPKCLFTFPNPKSKGQDLILPLQDQGS
jgi:hypothetical protein